MFQLNNWFKRVLLSSAIFLAILLLAGTAFAATEINTVADLKKIGSVDAGWTMDDEYILMKNITLTDSEWTAIGNNSTPFTGSFDGNGNAIILQSRTGNIAFKNDGTASGFGLFGDTEGAVFSNVLIHVKCNLTAPYVQGADRYDAKLSEYANVNYFSGFGILVGKAYGDITDPLNPVSTLIQNSKVFVDSDFTFDGTKNQAVGGIVGRGIEVTVQDCIVDNSGTFYSTNNGLGGIIGSTGVSIPAVDHSSTGNIEKTIYGNVTIENGTFNGTIKSSRNSVGGLVGVGHVNVYNSSVYGDLSGWQSIGGVIGNASTYVGFGDSVFKNISVYANISFTQNDSQYNANSAGGIIARTLNSSQTITIEDCLFSGKISPDSTVKNKTVNKEYRVGTSTHVGGIVGNSGNGTKELIIKNATVTDSTLMGSTRVGGIIGSTSYNNDNGGVNSLIVENSHVLNTEITGGLESGGFAGYFGSLAAGDKASIKDSSASVNIFIPKNDGTDDTTSDITNIYYEVKAGTENSIGGFVGLSKGDVSIEKSFASATINDKLGSKSVGGFIGTSSRGTKISECYSVGTVNGVDKVGGFVGFMSSVNLDTTITDCYFTGTVSGTSNVGDFLGSVDATNPQKNFISNSYAAGNLKKFAGTPLTSVISNCFYLADADDAVITLPFPEAKGVKAETMKATATFTAVVPANGWSIREYSAVPNSEKWVGIDGFMYPKLSWQKQYDDYVIEVATVDDLKNIASGTTSPDYTRTNKIWLPNVKYIQVADITFPSSELTTSVVTDEFEGTYDGNIYAIKDLNINANADDIGLFSSINGATLVNIKLENADVIGKDNVGALVGQSKGSSIIAGCSVDDESTVYGDDNVGGLVGLSDSTGTLDIVGSFSGAEVVAANNAGGLVGDLTGSVSLSYSTNSVESTGNNAGDNAGGLVGVLTDGSVSESYSDAEITATNNAGGLVGSVTDGLIFNSYSLSVVEATTSAAGGLVGYAADVIIDASYSASQSISAATSNAGGLVGSAVNADLKNSFALAKSVSAAADANRLVGSYSGALTLTNALAFDKMDAGTGAAFDDTADEYGVDVTAADIWNRFPLGTWFTYSSFIWGASPNSGIPVLLWQTVYSNADVSYLTYIPESSGGSNSGTGSGKIIDGSNTGYSDQTTQTTQTTDSGNDGTTTPPTTAYSTDSTAEPQSNAALYIILAVGVIIVVGAASVFIIRRRKA